MASKNDQPSSSNQSSRSTKTSSPKRTPEKDSQNTDNSKNSASTSEQVVHKEKNEETKKNTEGKVFKTRGILEKELVQKTQQLNSLQQQMKQLQDSLNDKQSDNGEEDSYKTLYEATKIELEKAQEELMNLAELKQKTSALSEENQILRERLEKQDEEIKRLSETIEEPKVSKDANVECTAPIHKILRKENVELHYEKDQLKLERDRLRRSLKEKQDQIDKMSASMGDLEDQLFKAKRALEDRIKASSRLEDRLLKVDGELMKYRERFAKQEKQNKARAEHVKSGKENENPSDKATLQKEKEYRNQKHVALLQKKEEKLLEDRLELEKEVTRLTTKIKELQNQLRKSRTEKQPTDERGSQTELGLCADIIATSKQCERSGPRVGKDSPSEATAVRKCKGIVKSLGKFFEELIQNQESPKGSSRGRRTAIAAQRANELLHELSVSMEQLASPKREQHRQGSGRVSGNTKYGSQVPSGSQGIGANNERTLWDKVSHEVAHHEFAFDKMSPTSNNQSMESTNEKDKQVKRAEKGLRSLYQAGSSGGSKSNESGKLAREDATKLMDFNRKQTELLMRELLGKHLDEMKALVENVHQTSVPVSPAVTLNSCDINTEGSGQNEAGLAVQELDNFKTRTVKVQSLILKMQALIDGAKEERESAHCQLHALENELQQKEGLLQAKTQELRRRHCKTLETEKALQAQIDSLTQEKERASHEHARLQDLCRRKDVQILEKIQEIKALHAEIGEREKMHQQNMNRMRKKVEEAWNQYASVKTRAEKKTAEFTEAAEKLKVSQGYLLDLWQTLKTVDNVVETNDNDHL